MIKITFFGSEKYSQIVLNALKEDKRFQLVSLKDNPEVGVLASYGRILKAEELSAPKQGILNIHPSLLPKYRGSTPVPTAILNGETNIGISIIKMDEEVDHGPIVAQFGLEILQGETAEELLKRAFTAGAQVLLTILPAYLENRIELKEQDHSQATYTKKFNRDDGKIDWKKPAVYIERQIRAFYPWPGTWTLLRPPKAGFVGQAKRLKILKAHLENKKLALDIVQLEGKKPVPYKQFREGYPKVKII